MVCGASEARGGETLGAFGSQFVRVEHVHVNEGGQAVIGNVKAPTGDGS
jgi:hypothetical protein